MATKRESYHEQQEKQQEHPQHQLLQLQQQLQQQQRQQPQQLQSGEGAIAATVATAVAAMAAASQVLSALARSHVGGQFRDQLAKQQADSNNNNNVNSNNNDHHLSPRSSSATPVAHSIPNPRSYRALSNPTNYRTVRTKYSTRRFSRRRVGPEEAMADPAIRATAQLRIPVVQKTILIVLKHRLTVQTAITLASMPTGDRLRKGAIQKKLEAMFGEPGAVEAFLAEWDQTRENK